MRYRRELCSLKEKRKTMKTIIIIIIVVVVGGGGGGVGVVLVLVVIIIIIIIIIIIFFTRGRYDPSGDIIVIIKYYCLEDQASSSIAEGKVPRKATRLNPWMDIDRR